MMDNENVTLEDMFDELDEWSKETDALNGVPIRSTEGDVRGLKECLWRKNGERQSIW